MTKLETIAQLSMRTDIPDIKPGDTVRVHQKIKEGDPSTGSTSSLQAGSGQAKERIQVFEGVVLARKHGKGVNATITVRKISQGIGVERIFPLHSPSLEKIEIVKRAKVRRAKLYYLRSAKGRKARLKAKEFQLEVPEKQPQAQQEQETSKEQPTEETAKTAPVAEEK